MTRLTRVAGYTAATGSAYALVALDVLAIPLVSKTTSDALVPVIPWWLLVAFGSYSLYSLGHGLYTFNDTPEAYEELMKEIAEAKNDLRAKGVTVD